MKYRGKLAKGAMMDKHKQEARGIVATINKTDSYWTCSQNEGDQLNLDLAWIPIADALRKRDVEIDGLREQVTQLMADNQVIVQCQDDDKAEIERLKKDLACPYIQVPASWAPLTVVYLKNGEKIVLRRDRERAWLEIVPQELIRAQESERDDDGRHNTKQR